MSVVTVVTGSGHHTVGPQKGRARILPKVIDLCEKLGYKYQEVKDVNGYAGGLNIMLTGYS